MPHGKHTRCSLCRATGHWRWIEVLWRMDLAGPWHCVVGWLCASCRAGYLDGVGQLGLEFLGWDG